MRKFDFVGKMILMVLMMVGSVGVGRGQIMAWDFSGQNSGPVTVAATTSNANLDLVGASNLITRGTTATASTANNSFRTAGFSNNGISTANTDYFQITLKAKTGFTLSLSTIDANFGGTATFFASPGVTSQFAYSINGTAFTLIGSSVQSTSLALTQINLSGISALQNVAATVTVTLRYYASGQTTTGGWGFLSASTTGTNGLAIGGALTSTSSVANPGTFTAATASTTQINLAATANSNGSNIVVVQNGTGVFSTPANGTAPGAVGTSFAGGNILYVGTAAGLTNHTSLTANTQYFYKAFSYDGSSSYSGGVTASTTTAKITPTNQITNLNKGAITTTAIPLTWTAAATGTQAPDGYLVKLSTGIVTDPANGTDPDDITTVNGSGLANVKVSPASSTGTVSFSGLAIGTMYNYKVYSYTNNSSLISFNTISVPSFNAATQPAAVTASQPISAISPTSVTFTWVNSSYDNSKHSTLVFLKASATAITQGAPSATPSTYLASSVFSTPGTAFQNDAGAYCVYNGDLQTVTVTGLTPYTTYQALIYTVVDAPNTGGGSSYSDAKTGFGTTPKNEPTNHATSFASGTTTNNTIPLTWADAIGASVPDGYLVKWSTISYAAITAPADGVPEADGTGVANIAAGTQFYTATGLSSSTTYYFKIWSYTNSSIVIDYKTNGTVPQISNTTLVAPCLAESFTGTTFPPTGWAQSSVVRSTTPADYNTGPAAATFTSTAGTLTTPVISNPASISFYLGRSSNTTDKTMNIKVSTTGQAGTFATVATFDHANVAISSYNQYTVNLSAYSSYSAVWVQFEKVSGTASPWRLDDIEVTCATVCTPPSTQASALTVSGVGSGVFNTSWTAGNGVGTMLVVRPTAQTNTLPISGTAYSADLAYGSAGAIDANNKVVFRAAGNAAGPVTGLAPETQYTVSAYAYSATDCYNTASPATTSLYTLSLEPATYAASFTAIPIAYNQINLAFSAASSVSNADGYIILQKSGSAPTGLPVDASAYTVGNAIGDATVAAIVNSTSITTASITGLSANTEYYFSLIPFNWNAAITATYNYKTDGSIPLTNATTLVQPSSANDIVFNSVAAESVNQNIDYAAYQSATIANTTNGANGSIGVMGFTIRDGGATGADADLLPTILTSISFNVTNVANIKSAALFNGNILIATVAVAGTSPITFSGLSGSNVTCADNTTLGLNLRVTFNATVTDNQKMVFTVASATAATASTSSLFAAGNAGGAVSENTAGDVNRIEVTADRISFGTQPQSGSVGINLAAFTVVATDVNNNIDLDANNSIALTTSGTGFTSGSPYTLTNGSVSINNVQFSSGQTGITLTATTTGLVFSNSVVSTAFNVSTVVANSYRTAGTGTWTNAAWERFIGGSWVSNAAPAANTTDFVYIRHLITATGSITPAKIVVQNGGTLTATGSSTFGTSLLVETGGILQVTSTLAVNGTFIVQTGGRVNINSSTTSGVSTLWNGTEDFQDGSIVEIQNWAYGASGGDKRLIQSPSKISINSNGYYFGNLIISGAPSSIFGMVDGSQTINLTKNDFTVSAAGASNVTFTTALSNVTIGGNLIITNNQFSIAASGSTGTITSTVLGNIQVSGGALSLNQNSSAATVSVIQLKGNLSVSSGASIISNNPNKISLSGTTPQTVSIAGTLGGNVIFEVASGSTAQLANQNLALPNSSNTFTTLLGGTVDFNGLNVTGSGSFVTAGGGILKITSPVGIASAGATGNVQTTIRSYSSAGIYEFEGVVTGTFTTTPTAATVAGLSINNSGGVTLSQSLTASNVNFTSGKLILGANSITASTFTGASSSGYIVTDGIGKLTVNNISSASTLFPIGTTTSYNPVTITNSSAASFAAKVSPTFTHAPQIPDRAVDREWDISRTGTGNATLTFQWQATDEHNPTTTARKTGGWVTAHYSGTNFLWEEEPSTVSGSGPFTVIRTGVNDFSPFAVGLNGAFTGTILPINLLSFNAFNQNGQVKLQWQTASETNLSQYEIQKSTDGRTFSIIGSVAAGSSTNEYSFTDAAANGALVYYRLKVLDKDGHFTYGKIIAVSLKNVAGLQLLPNPVRSTLFATYTKAGNNASLSLVSISGSILASYTVPAESVQYSLNTSLLLPGTYILRYNNNGIIENKRFIKQ